MEVSPLDALQLLTWECIPNIKPEDRQRLEASKKYRLLGDILARLKKTLGDDDVFGISDAVAVGPKNRFRETINGKTDKTFTVELMLPLFLKLEALGFLESKNSATQADKTFYLTATGSEAAVKFSSQRPNEIRTKKFDGEVRISVDRVEDGVVYVRLAVCFS